MFFCLYREHPLKPPFWEAAFCEPRSSLCGTIATISDTQIGVDETIHKLGTQLQLILVLTAALSLLDAASSRELADTADDQSEVDETIATENK